MPEVNTVGAAVKITLAADETAMLDNLCHVWSIKERAIICRKLVIDGLKEYRESGVIPRSKEQLAKEQ